MTATVTILRPGLSAVTDLGRNSAGRVGQMTAGALDQQSARLANALVGCPDDNPLVEIVLLDFAATTTVDLLVAVTGTRARVRQDGVTMHRNEPFVWRAGTTLAITGLEGGSRAYLAIRRELQVPRLLGSCAPDSVLGFSGALRAGEQLQVVTDPRPLVNPLFGIPVLRVSAPRPDFGQRWTIPVTDGPDRAEFGRTGDRLFRGTFTVTAQSNHVGLRFTSDDGQVPRRDSTTEVLSRGVPIGAVEVPAGNELLVLHRGRGVTAGYPVLAVVTQIGLSRLGQARAGHTVEFVHTTVAQAVAGARHQQAGIEQIRRRVLTVLRAHGAPVHHSEYRQSVPSQEKS